MTSAISRTLGRALPLIAFGLLTLVGSEASPAVVVRTGVAYRPVARAPVYHPVARTAAVVGTAVVVGSVVRTLPPACSAVVINGIAYQQCGSTWYRPAYAGSAVTYSVIAPPR
jgi:hypothetical protein